MQYVIGIGANLGFLLENIQLAIAALNLHTKITIIKKASLYSSKAIVKQDAPESWKIIFINTAVKIQSDLKPDQLLIVLKDIERSIGRNLKAPRWSPRIIDLDILASTNLILETDILTIPHKELIYRSFALAPLLELDKNWHHPGHVGVDLNAKLKELGRFSKLKQRLSNTMRMGIVNLSNQSFSDYNLNTNQRKSNLNELIKAGAEIIDIGAESTKPHAKTMSADEEFFKLDNFLEYIRLQMAHFKYMPLISVDTRKLQVMQKVLQKHHNMIWMINDVECSDIEQKAKLIAKYNKKYVITHNLGIVDRDQYLEKEKAIDEVCKYIENKKAALLSQGVRQENIYFDVGFGFGKKSDTAKHLLANLNKIKDTVKLKVLVGHSRKASILDVNKNAGIEILDKATKKLSEKLTKQNIDILRVHKI